MKTWAIFEVHAGDKRAGWTREQRIKAAQRGGDLGPDPVHHFYIMAPDAFELGVVMAPAFKKFNARTSDDLPKPFDLQRIAEGETIEATEATAQNVARQWLGKPDAEVHVATKALYRELVAAAKEKRRSNR